MTIEQLDLEIEKLKVEKFKVLVSIIGLFIPLFIASLTFGINYSKQTEAYELEARVAYDNFELGIFDTVKDMNDEQLARFMNLGDVFYQDEKSKPWWEDVKKAIRKGNATN